MCYFHSIPLRPRFYIAHPQQFNASGRGLDGVKLIVGDKCMGMLEAVGEVFPDAKYQRCTVHFYRNVFSVVPKNCGKNAQGDPRSGEQKGVP